MISFIKKYWWWIIGYVFAAGASMVIAGFYVFKQILSFNPKFFIEGGEMDNLIPSLIAGYVGIIGLAVLGIGILLAEISVVVKILHRFQASPTKIFLVTLFAISLSVLLVGLTVRWRLISLDRRREASLPEIKPDFNSVENLETSKAAGKMPWIFAAVDNQLVRLVFDESSNNYQVDKKAEIDLRGRIEAGPSGVYLKDGSKLVKYSLDLEKTSQWEPGDELGVGGNLNFPSAYFDYVLEANKLFVLAGKYLVILDESLNPISQLPLEVRKGYPKGAHRIAYLLDNVVRPIYVLKVDVSDPKIPELSPPSKLKTKLQT